MKAPRPRPTPPPRRPDLPSCSDPADELRAIESPRLRLRRLRASDERELIALDSDPDVMRYVGSPPGPRTPDETAERVRQRIQADQGPLGFWLVESRADGGMHGLCALIRMPTGDDIELAYRFARPCWGQGIASEAVAVLVEHGLVALNLPRIVAEGVRAAYYVITRGT